MIICMILSHKVNEFIDFLEVNGLSFENIEKQNDYHGQHYTIQCKEFSIEGFQFFFIFEI